jgi:hypothetical protein
MENSRLGRVLRALRHCLNRGANPDLGRNALLNNGLWSRVQFALLPGFGILERLDFLAQRRQVGFLLVQLDYWL